MKRLVALLASVALGVAAVLALVAWQRLATFRDTPFGDPAEKVVEVPPGAPGRAVVRLLARANVVSDERLAWWYTRWVRRDPRPFRAGEYVFAGPLTPDQALERIQRGEVRLHRFTVPEGLRADEVAAVVERSGLAPASEFLAIARDPAVAGALALPYPGLEGFLFPDTYAFAKGVSARAIAEAMVARFKEEYGKADAARDPEVRLGVGATATLASIVERETGRPEERGRIACVFLNRLRVGMRLQTDPTVMYATMLRTGRWSRNITRADLLAPHPYNTYTTAGLPPGPIASAGAGALRAALAPERCSDLYFVSRNDGTHVFCPDLACHNAAVRTWQVDFFKQPAASPAPAPAPGAPRKRSARAR